MRLVLAKLFRIPDVHRDGLHKRNELQQPRGFGLRHARFRLHLHLPNWLCGQRLLFMCRELRKLPELLADRLQQRHGLQLAC